MVESTRTAEPVVTPASPRGDAGNLLRGLGLVLIAVVCFAPSLRNDFIWDDDHYVTDNVALRSFNGLLAIWSRLGTTPQYYPLTFTTFWCEYQAWGTWAAGYHATNILLHATCAVLLWRLLLRLEVPGAWLAAAIFAVHPVEVESVAWITERKNVLSLALALGSMLCYLRFAPPARSDYPPTADKQAWRCYDLAFALFVASLLCKSVTASLPAVLLVIYWWKRGALGWQDVQPLLRFFIAGIAFGLLTAWVETRYVGAEGEEWAASFFERCLIAGRAVWFYAGKLAWPQPLVFFYPRWDINTHDVVQWLYPLAAIALLVVAWQARHWLGRGTLAALLIFGGVLFPALGFLNVYPFRYSFVADHFQYHASLALIALGAATLTTILGPLDRRVAPAAWALSAALLIPLGLTSIDRQSVFHDRVSLYTDTISQNPACWMAYNNLGTALATTGRPTEAVPFYEQAIRMRPTHVEAYNNLGLILISLQRANEAVALLEQAAQLDPSNATVQDNLARALLAVGQPERAIEHLEKALELSPKFMGAAANLAESYRQAGRLREAREVAQKALTQARHDGQTAVVQQLEAWLKRHSNEL